MVCHAQRGIHLAGLEAKALRWTAEHGATGSLAACDVTDASAVAALDFFVVYSAATTCLGNPGQSNYVAANAFLESLVLLRRASGQPATFMSWGPVDDVGFLSRNQETRDTLEACISARSIASGEAMAVLGRVLAAGDAGEALFRVDWGVRPVRSHRARPARAQQHRAGRAAERRQAPRLPAQRLAGARRSADPCTAPIPARADRNRGPVRHGRRFPRSTHTPEQIGATTEALERVSGK